MCFRLAITLYDFSTEIWKSHFQEKIEIYKLGVLIIAKIS